MEWISVNDNLPEEGISVLVSNGEFVCESYLKNKKWIRGGVEIFYMTPTHWMFFPKPPKGE